MANSKTAAVLLTSDDHLLAAAPKSAVLDALADGSEDPAAQAARAEALERLALSHAMCDQAADACFYLCRSLGLARQQQSPDAAPDLELLFQLLGALADLPAEVSAMPLPEGEADGLGVAELCHQLSAARDLTTAAWHDAAEQDDALAACPTAPAHALH